MQREGGRRRDQLPQQMEVCCRVHADAFESEGKGEEGGEVPCHALILTALICHTGSCYIMVQTVQGLPTWCLQINRSKLKPCAVTGLGGKRRQGSWGLMGQPEDGDKL